MAGHGGSKVRNELVEVFIKVNIYNHTAFTYDDILLEPRKFSGTSRREIDLSTEICGARLDTPIIAAPMDTVVDKKTVMKLENLGALGIIHRFCDYKSIVKDLIKNDYFGVLPIGLIKNYEADEQIYETQPSAILIEVAHAHQSNVLKLAEFIKGTYPKIPLMVGNIATKEAAIDFAKIGVDAIKVGVGPSPVCSTRSVTGCGVPQATAVRTVYYGILASSGKRPKIIADGGIKNSGDIVKALALGADAVMTGSLLAQATDGPGEVFHIDGVAYKTYRGMASEDVMKERGIKRAAEGVTAKIRATKPLDEILQDLTDGIQSGLSYLGFNSLKELKENRDSIFAHLITNASRVETSTI